MSTSAAAPADPTTASVSSASPSAPTQSAPARSAPADTHPHNAPSRRELNRQATHAAIVAATLDLAESEAWEEVTVERVAERAGVSRRTFFNYFRTLDDALHAPLYRLVESAATQMAGRDAPMDQVLGELAQILQNVLTIELLSPAARVMLVERRHPELATASHAAWDRCVAALVPGPDEADGPTRFFANTLVRSAMAVAQAAFAHWAEDLSEPLTEADVARLRELVGSGLRLLSTGFAVPDGVDAQMRCAIPTGGFDLTSR